MGRAKVIKPAIQDQPVTFSSIVSNGSLTVNGTITVSGSINISGSEDLVVNDITASGNISASGDIFANTGSLRHITNIDEIRKDSDTFIKFEDSKLTLNSFGTTANSILEIGSLAGDEAFVVKADNVRFNSYGNNPFIHCLHSINSTQFFQDITSSGVFSSSNEIITNGFTNVGSTSTTLSSSFTTTLNFSTNRIMSVTTGSALSMSIDPDPSILGNVIMTDISSSVGLHLTGSEFKVLNGTFDTTKRNYVYYHYIGNDTALVTINQEL